MQLELVEKTIATIYDTVSKLVLKIIAVILVISMLAVFISGLILI